MPDWSKSQPVLSIVAPFYNEAAMVDLFYEALQDEVGLLEDVDIRYVFVDDGDGNLRSGVRATYPAEHGTKQRGKNEGEPKRPKDAALVSEQETEVFEGKKEDGSHVIFLPIMNRGGFAQTSSETQIRDRRDRGGR